MRTNRCPFVVGCSDFLPAPRATILTEGAQPGVRGAAELRTMDELRRGARRRAADSGPIGGLHDLQRGARVLETTVEGAAFEDRGGELLELEPPGAIFAEGEDFDR